MKPHVGDPSSTARLAVGATVAGSSVDHSEGLAATINGPTSFLPLPSDVVLRVLALPMKGGKNDRTYTSRPAAHAGTGLFRGSGHAPPSQPVLAPPPVVGADRLCGSGQ